MCLGLSYLNFKKKQKREKPPKNERLFPLENPRMKPQT